MTASKDNQVRIMLIEDNPEYRLALSMAIERCPRFILAEKYGTAEQALSALQKAGRPVDLILLDLNLPKMQGLESIHWIREYSPETKIIVLTQSDKKADVLKAIRMGASGYLLKSSSMAEIRDGIEGVIQGGASLDPSIATYLLDQIKTNQSENSQSFQLSKRELEVLHHLSQGQPRKQIADILGITENTVVTHVRNVYEKMDVPNAPAAITTAYQSGILPIQEVESSDD